MIRAIFLILAMVCIAAAGAWWYFSVKDRSAAGEARSSASPAALSERTITEGIPGEATREYRNNEFRFSLQYPQSLTVKEYDEAGGALSVTFQSTVDDKEFQIYMTPYADTQITEARFRLDVPSGVRTEAVDVMIDGVRATVFFSENSLMGETREVWFVNGGFLYEIVTYKELDEWLAHIMMTWKFIP